MYFPRVKKEILTQNEFAVTGALTLSVENDFAKKAQTALSLFIPYTKVELCNNAVITAKNTLKESEHYHIVSKASKIEIEYFDYLGLRNALSTISQMARFENGVLHFPETEIMDFPEASWRGVMLDPAREPMEFEVLKQDLILAAKCKMNIFHFHLSEAKGVAVELDCLPGCAHHRRAYTKAEVKELCELCDAIGLEIVPEFDMPGHSTRITSVLPELKCECNLEKRSDWVVCAGNEKTYEVYEKIIAELCKMFPNGNYFHMGGDELYMLDEAGITLNYICHWDDCKKCRAVMEKQGIDMQGLYYHFTNRINAIVKKYGRRMIMWSDQIDCNRPLGIDKDVIMQFWRVAGKLRGPHENCSMQKQLEYGYTMINSSYPETYFDFEKYMSVESLSTWHWQQRPECKPENRHQIIGSEVCAWEYGNEKEYMHYAYTLPSAVALMGDKLWNGELGSYTTAEEIAATKTLLGACVPKDFNVFAAIGSIFPPRDIKTFKHSYPEKVTISVEKIKEIISLLESKNFKAGDKERAKQYINCAEYTLNYK